MAWTHPAYESLAQLLSQHAGLSFPEVRAGNAELGIRRAMSRKGIEDPERFRELVVAQPDALLDLVAEMTIGETYFFRETAQFDFIRREVLADLRQRQHGEPSIRAWSAACASGEEAYSLAMLFEEERLAAKAYLLATDVSGPALAKARRACFTSWSLRGEGAAAALPYLHSRGAEFVLQEKIRRRVRFEFLNLAQDVYPSTASGVWGMDLILCRNVLIYFDRETIRNVARRLYHTLAPGGWLFTASSDPPLIEEAPFEPVVTSVGVFYRRGGDTPARPLAVTTWILSPPPSQSPVVDDVVNWSELPLTVPSTPSVPVLSPDTSHPISTTALNPVDEARNELLQGNYSRASELTKSLTSDAVATALHVRALANLDTAQAERACAEASAQHPFSTELHYLHAVLLLALRREGDAIRALRRVLYLDRTLIIVHFTLAAILEQRGDLRSASRAYRNVRDLCAEREGQELVPFADGASAGQLAAAAAARLTFLTRKDEG